MLEPIWKFPLAEAADYRKLEEPARIAVLLKPNSLRQSQGGSESALATKKHATAQGSKMSGNVCSLADCQPSKILFSKSPQGDCMNLRVTV
jgi:hypothetical protein